MKKKLIDESQVIVNLNELIAIQRDQIDAFKDISEDFGNEIEFNKVIEFIFFEFLEKKDIEFHELLEYINEQSINGGDASILRDVVNYISDRYKEFFSKRKRQ